MNPRKMVLIVDDDTAFAESNRDLLEAYGYEVHAANDGKSGLEMAKRLKPDIIILDVMMTTDTEGIEMARAIAEAPGLRHTGVLLVTGITKALNLPKTPRLDDTWLPVDRILEKPILPARLLAEIEKVLEEKSRIQRPS